MERNMGENSRTVKTNHLPCRATNAVRSTTSHVGLAVVSPTTMPELSNSPFAPGPLNQVRAKRDRARYDASDIFAILDQAMVAHVGFVDDGRPKVIPMIFGRDEDRLYLHGVRN